MQNVLVMGFWYVILPNERAESKTEKQGRDIFNYFSKTYEIKNREKSLLVCAESRILTVRYNLLRGRHMKKRYIVKLSSEERENLEDLIHRGRHAADRRRRAQILLLVDEGDSGPALTDIEAAQTMGVSRRGVEIVRERCVMEGLEQAVNRKKRTRERSRKLDGEAEAQLTQIACSEAPQGQARWTVRMLADRLVKLEVVETISEECVRQTLKKMI